MRELERLIEALQKNWLVRKYVNKTNPPPSLRSPCMNHCRSRPKAQRPRDFNVHSVAKPLTSAKVSNTNLPFGDLDSLAFPFVVAFFEAGRPVNRPFSPHH